MPKVAMTKTQAPTVWAGPEDEGPNGGVTQSMLSRWLCCRERFRLMVIDGLRPKDTFNHRIEYGQMWHVCEEFLASNKAWAQGLRCYCEQLCRRYPLQQEQVQHWYNVCMAQFPVYVDYWSKHPDVKNRVPLMQEQVFHVPYRISTSRAVWLRGKFDSVDLIGKGKNASVYLQENKTKGDIDEQQVKRQLGFDLQTMMYLTALGRCPAEELRERPIAGVRYNIVRRPLSGGKHSIRQHQPTKSNPTGETSDAFYARLGGLITEEPEYFFMRWRVEVPQMDVRKFCLTFLDNVLVELCHWWDWVSSPVGRSDPFGHSCHWRHPFGIYNPLNEGGSSDLDEYLATGSEIGLDRGRKLFGELE